MLIYSINGYKVCLLFSDNHKTYNFRVHSIVKLKVAYISLFPTAISYCLWVLKLQGNMTINVPYTHSYITHLLFKIIYYLIYFYILFE